MNERIPIYRHITNQDFVYKDEAEDYALAHLGLTIKPLEKDGSYTQEQIDFLGEFTEWYFSGEWIEDFIELEDVR